MPREADLAERLRELTGGSATVLRLHPSAYADQYFAVLRASLKDVGTEGDAHVIYVSVTNPATLVWSVAQALDVPADRVSFIDAISHTIMNYRDALPNAVYVESPRMLEDIMLRIEFLLRKRPTQRPIVLIDSASSLAIHNPLELLSEFLHILLSNLKSRQVVTLLLIVSDDPSSPLEEMLSLIVDETIDVRHERS